MSAGREAGKPATAWSDDVLEMFEGAGLPDAEISRLLSELEEMGLIAPIWRRGADGRLEQGVDLSGFMDQAPAALEARRRALAAASGTTREAAGKEARRAKEKQRRRQSRANRRRAGR